MVERISQKLLENVYRVEDSEVIPSSQRFSHYEGISETLPILLLNGVNLNMLGLRDPQVYGTFTLSDVEELVKIKAAEHGAKIIAKQSNNEGEFIELIHAAVGNVRGIVINPGAWGSDSLAIADALDIVQVPKVEVHISNIFAREQVRRNTFLASVVDGVVAGLGIYSYPAAVEYIIKVTKRP